MAPPTEPSATRDWNPLDRLSVPIEIDEALFSMEADLPKVSQKQLDERRRQILDAAITCFARKGFHYTTMAEIATEAGVSDTLAYRYFSGKDEIIEAAMGELGDDSLVLTDDVESPRSLTSMLLASNRQRFDDRLAMSALMGARFRSWAEALHDGGIRREVVDRWRHFLEAIGGMIDRAADRGEIPSTLDPEALARVMLATHYGLNLQAILDPDVDLEKCAEVMVSLVFGDRDRAEEDGKS